MKAPKRAKLLTLDQLETWFDKAEPAPPCRGVSTLNGFLTGLAAGPVFLLPNDWMFHVIGKHEEKAFVGNKTYAVIETIVDHYNLIAHQLTAPRRYAPMFMRTDDEEVLPGDWADGFYGAIKLNLAAWAPHGRETDWRPHHGHIDASHGARSARNGLSGVPEAARGHP